MARSRIVAMHNVTPLAALIARAAGNNHRGSFGKANLHGAVIELARITRGSIIEHGVTASDDLRAAIDEVAGRHLNRAAADRELSRTLRKIGDPQLRNAIEVAHGQVLEPSEVAHYYAGLMAGLAFVDLARNRR